MACAASWVILRPLRPPDSDDGERNDTTGKRTRRIIAVFGGSDRKEVLDLAEEIGRVISDEEHILLTGGAGPGAKDPETVKNRAIEGVHESPWIGIDRKKVAHTECRREGRWGFVITTDLGRQRNYLEAFMSDAVTLLEGEDGTRSELTSALSLQRPVAFVGEHWKATCDRLDKPATRSGELDDLHCITVKKFARIAQREPRAQVSNRLEDAPSRAQQAAGVPVVRR